MLQIPPVFGGQLFTSTENRVFFPLKKKKEKCLYPEATYSDGKFTQGLSNKTILH